MTNEEAVKVIKSECYVANLLNLDRTRMINTALDKAVEALEQTELNPSYNGVKSELEQTRWIPCSEKMPDVNIHVLAQFVMGGMAECYEEDENDKY